MKFKSFLVTLLAVVLLTNCSDEKNAVNPSKSEEEVKKIPAFLDDISLNAPLTDASTNRKKTDEMSAKEFKRIMESEQGKKAYMTLMNIFNSNISRVASEGYNDTFVITFMNDRQFGIPNAFAGLTRLEQNYVRAKVIYDLEQKGYTIQYNQYWDNPESINISVSW